ncbi:DivIVA domain-containing protein [Sinomonas gamaensis]|jgi:DivIVA domain-containing protein|uniref:DivIVA domain-containing protein n=1 Tax=Sinomonas gamaensis TaxID=2565624 RepID=UPI001108F6B7|nr:DivIVA domain-containing protein [Sinomonas gamaensis]
MALTPEDVVNKRFQPTKFREGYDQDEVDDFLDEIVIELRRLNQENDELRKKVAELTSKGPGAPAEKPAAAPEPKPAEVVKPEPPQPAPAAVPAQGSVTQTAESAAGLLAMAQQMHDKHVQDGIEQRDKIIAEAQIEASSLVNEAQEKSRKTLGALEQQRSVLERKVEQLRGFERDYRARLKAYIEGQLRDLDARGSVVSSEIPDNAEV